MAEQSGFFNSNVVNGNYDREYLAEDFAKYFASFVGNGIFGGKSNELLVIQSTDTGMKVDVSPGMGWINGYWYENTSKLTLNIDVSDGVLNRIDSVVIRWGKAERKAWLAIAKGAPAATAVAAAVQRTADYYELKLAEIYVKAGTTKITQAEITDTRLDSNVCGIVKGLIDQIDTTEFGKQLQGYIEKYAADYKTFIDDLETTGTSQLNALVEQLNAIVEDESAFGNLVLRAAKAESKLALAEQTLGYIKKNLIPYPYLETTKVINGITFTDNGDGTITANGTATAESRFPLFKGEMPQPGKYLLSAGVSVSESFYVCIIRQDKVTEETVGEIYKWHNSTPFEVTANDVANNNIFVAIVISSGTAVSNLVFKPMLRKAEISDATWELYKPSVAEMMQEDQAHPGCFYRMNRKTNVKEWINPPSVPGVEYALTEKLNGKIVYQKTFYAASLPNSSVMVLDTGIGWEDIISVSGYAFDTNKSVAYPFPVTLKGQVVPAAIINRIEGSGSLIITTNSNVSNLKSYVSVTYTKSAS